LTNLHDNVDLSTDVDHVYAEGLGGNTGENREENEKEMSPNKASEASPPNFGLEASPLANMESASDQVQCQTESASGQG
jgi:hypothetical protein